MSHLDLKSRLMIETGLNSNKTKKEIADELDKDPSTIGKEIKNHLQFKSPPDSNLKGGKETCVHIKECKQCLKPTACIRYEVPACDRRDHKPGYCNGCERKKFCRLHKIVYSANSANDVYKQTLKESRQGHNNTHADIDFLKSEIAKLIKQGQTPYAICANHPEFQISERAIYYWVKEGKLKDYGVISLDLKEAVKRKLPAKSPSKRNSSCFIGHLYKNFIEALEKDLIGVFLEMDTVYNNPSGPYILTFIEPKTKFMFGKLLSEKTCINVAKSLRQYRQVLGEDFNIIFSTLLTDRGSEFYNVDMLQFDDKTGEKITTVYYCDPMQSSQKPHVENNHNLIRDILPNERDLHGLTQNDIDLMFSHINSYPRKVLNGKTPYYAFESLFGKGILEKLKIIQIEKDKVKLTPDLI